MTASLVIKLAMGRTGNRRLPAIHPPRLHAWRTAAALLPNVPKEIRGNLPLPASPASAERNKILNRRKLLGWKEYEHGSRPRHGGQLHHNLPRSRNIDPMGRAYRRLDHPSPPPLTLTDRNTRLITQRLEVAVLREIGVETGRLETSSSRLNPADGRPESFIR